MSADYDDGIISCDSQGVEIRGYYFPWGSKRVRYAEIRGLQRFTVSPLKGQWRVWGSANFKLWANLDLKRPKKTAAFIIDNQKSVKPFVTPDRPDDFEALVRERAHLGPSTGETPPAPFI